MTLPALDFVEVVRALEQPLRRALMRRVGDPVLAEDLLQETWLRIHRGLAGFDGRAQLKTWAFAIANHVVADHFRRPEGGATFVDIEALGSAPAADVPLDDGIAIDEMNGCVRDAIAALPPDYRHALVLHDLEGMTAPRAAELSGCSVATAKIRIHRARQRLREALSRQCDFYHDRESVFRCAPSQPAGAGPGAPRDVAA